jgi:DNA-binding XRE family transcriptional regulator
MQASILIKSYRAKRGLSQVALADQSGVPQTTISDIEHGNNPNWETMKKLARVLNITVEDLMGTTEEVKQ